MPTTYNTEQERFKTITNLYMKDEIDYSLYIGFMSMIHLPIFEEQLHKLKGDK